MYKYNKYFDLVLLAAVGYYLALTPFSKVEESFNTQAIHDVANFGVFPLDVVEHNYDHKQFPGAVPRTFIGSLVIGGIVGATNKLLSLTGVELPTTEIHLQYYARGLLGLLTWFSLTKLRNTINAITLRDKSSKVKGLIGFWFSIIMLSQFHVLYYSTRFLPNFIALPGVIVSFDKLLRGDMSGLTWLAFLAVIFRLEIGVLAVLIALVSSGIFGQSNIFLNVVMLAAGTIAGALTSFFIDSYFWGYWCIPELFAFKYNVIDGNSELWGVEPWNAYFTKYLLALFRPPVVLILSIPGLTTDPAEEGKSMLQELEQAEKENKPSVTQPARNSLRILFIASVLYVAVMSFQPHKEWRFIVYVVPVFMLQAANGLSNISMRWSTSLFSKILVFIMLANLFVGTILSLFIGYASSFNYPGGDAITHFNQYVQDNNINDVTVHLGVASCMTGALKFAELNSSFGITYDKTEDEGELSKIWNNMDYIITESNLKDINGPKHLIPFEKDNWELVHVSNTFAGVTIAPLLNLLEEQKKTGNAIPSLISQIVHEIIELKARSPTFIRLIEGMVVKHDFLYTLKRINKDKEPLEIKEVPETVDIQEDKIEVINDIKEQVEVDVNDVIEEINEEIDTYEEE